MPIVTPPPGAPAFAGQLQASAEVFDNLISFGTIFVPGKISLPSVSTFAPQGLAGGETIRLTAFSYPPTPCVATLSFADHNGRPLGSTLPVSLSGVQSASLDLNANALSLKLGQRVEVQPIVTLTPLVGDIAPQALACPASVEVFDHLTNRTWTYQMGLPAVQ